jgi:hypothetical protein
MRAGCSGEQRAMRIEQVPQFTRSNAGLISVRAEIPIVTREPAFLNHASIWDRSRTKPIQTAAREHWLACPARFWEVSIEG